MNKLLVNILPLLFFTTAGFYSVSISNNQQKVDDWVGEYEIVVPNIFERVLLAKQNNKKGAYFSADNTKTLYLKKDMTFEHTATYPKRDSTVTKYYTGHWEIKDKKTFLHFKHDSYHLQHSSVSKKIYYIEYLKSCRDTTQGAFFFNVFKKTD